MNHYLPTSFYRLIKDASARLELPGRYVPIKSGISTERAQGLFQVHSIEKEGILFIDLLTRFPCFIRNVPVHRIDEGMKMTSQEP
ncbi:hypothetical protein RGU11_00305 [Rossellomorea marisflavi]|uniref:hypothetical protein n=1 Tax=Rossellomorea marisflavi TaxID=189381 RepID=UPI0028530EDD|nr:hypothetical protein [Rossellomorea marisflavi]MDR4934824.1 hypothetical protein [Rossellomorea marisflavi]